MTAMLTELEALRDALLEDADRAAHLCCPATAAAFRDAADRLGAIIGRPTSTPRPPVETPAPRSPQPDWKLQAAGEGREGIADECKAEAEGRP